MGLNVVYLLSVPLLVILCGLFGHGPKELEAADRIFPWCVTHDTLVEYGHDSKSIADKDGNPYVGDFHQKGRHVKIMKSFVDNKNTPIKNFHMTRIRNLGKWTGVRLMYQWIHITIETTKPLKFLLVQAISSPFGLPDGEFDLEFSCQDCGDGINWKGAEEGNAIPGMIVPCSKRAYINVRHPTVYTFDTSNPSNHAKKNRFHMNFNFVDVLCRHILMLQFMILAVDDKDNVEMIYTPIIDHDFVDSVEGMPWPFHISIADKFYCHKPDSELGVDEKLNLFMIPKGNKFHLYVNQEYDTCVIKGGPTVPEISPHWLCKLPEARRCDMESPLVGPNSNIVASQKKQPAYPADNETDEIEGDPGAHGGAQLCPVCNYSKSNDITREAYRRYVHRGYLARRLHGVSMIFGTIAALVVSIHLARYFKETGGGRLLVGWWAWGHLGLTFVGTLSVWIGFSVAVGMKARYHSKNDNPFIGEKRTALMKIHSVMGWFTLFVYHLVLLNGYSRPLNFMWRKVMIWLHALGGHAQIFFATMCVIFSTACRETILWTLFIVIFSIVNLVAAMIIQIFFYDKDMATKRSRGLFPIIESIRIQRPMPMKWPRFGILIGLSFITSAAFALLTFKGSHHGLFFTPCENCRWKWDELLVRTQTPALTYSWYFHQAFGCNYEESVWEPKVSL